MTSLRPSVGRRTKRVYNNIKKSPLTLLLSSSQGRKGGRKGVRKDRRKERMKGRKVGGREEGKEGRIEGKE